METPDTEDEPRPKMPPAPKVDNGYNIGLTRKILIGIFILGFWGFFYWFKGS
jgi:hypothetical protein